ncbi:hypothetical protein NQ315_007010 [Exocentrus adspersus]|uniref:Uncharacterized protein n=1 Tax=Exocentrus adspersus TaxID=1586481 RepID=A0AAV8WCA5_9CUCU|nr:hypothetical protein NQ315_007010 [Exocentrus adspersus]
MDMCPNLVTRYQPQQPLKPNLKLWSDGLKIYKPFPVLRQTRQANTNERNKLKMIYCQQSLT